jgi:hypothetical protein
VINKKCQQNNIRKSEQINQTNKQGKSKKQTNKRGPLFVIYKAGREPTPYWR